jgi:hypothetical protein
VKPTEEELLDIFDEVEKEDAEIEMENLARGPPIKQIGERDILVSEYQTGNPLSRIHRDHSSELAAFRVDDYYTHLNAFLRSYESSKLPISPAFLIQLMYSMGLVANHLQHQKLDDSCLVVDVLVHNLARETDVNLAITVYLVFGAATLVVSEKLMESKYVLINHIFDLRRVTIEEQTRGKLYDTLPPDKEPSKK